MKNTIAILLACSSTAALAQSVHTRDGYVRKDGTYVAASVATMPNNTKLDNFSTKGNVNPYTGKEGTKDPFAAPSYSPNNLRPLQPR
jgi:hypothetical protein